MTENLQHFQPQRLIPATEIVRPDNCDSAVGFAARCQHCGQLHLRPGYCQALDPVSPGFTGSKVIQTAARAKLRAEFEKVHGPIATDKPAAVTQLPESVTQLAGSVTQPEVGVTQLTRRCEQCGGGFEASPFRPDARYCSPACRVKAHRAKA